MRRARSAGPGGFGAYLSARAGYFAFFTALFVVAVGFGAAAVRALSEAQKAELLDYLEVYLRGLGRSMPATPGSELWYQAVSASLRTAALLWASGLVALGLLLAPAVVFMRGFVVGFAVGFLTHELGMRGILLATLAVFPQNLLSVPATLVIATASSSYSLSILRRRGSRAGAGRVNVAGYTIIVLAMMALLVLAATIEAYVAPVFMRLISGYGGG
ncbi:MAG: stage II sporulation protein M [Bacillota bacterium]|nr:stage II sporulation protein M [Bacillota bacterium]